jgi:hypothetical protein
LGGAISGALTGVYLGALAGLGIAAWAHDLAAVLDGALLGAGALALIGGAYGTILGLTEPAPSTGFLDDQLPPAPAPTSSLPRGGAAVTLHGNTPTSPKEHSHGR